MPVTFKKLYDSALLLHIRRKVLSMKDLRGWRQLGRLELVSRMKPGPLAEIVKLALVVDKSKALRDRYRAMHIKGVMPTPAEMRTTLSASVPVNVNLPTGPPASISSPTASRS